jgi:hypothetical protein
MVVVIVGAFIVLPMIELVGQLLLEKPVFGPVPALAGAKKFTGVLHFGRGSRDWRESELRLADGIVLPLKCKLFKASDACFNLKQGEQYEGTQATVWWDPGISVLQLRVGEELVVRYAETVERFARYSQQGSDNSFLIDYFSFIAVLFLTAFRFTSVSMQKFS